MTKKPELAAVLEHYGLNVIDKHGWIPCKCILHDDSHASAAYNLDSQVYNCLVCQILGDVYTLVQNKEGLDFKNAKRRAEAIANGRSTQIRQLSNRGSGLLPRGTRHQQRSGGYVPSWKRKRA